MIIALDFNGLRRVENGLVDLELLEVSTKKIMNSLLLPNQVLIDVANVLEDKLNVLIKKTK